MQDIVKVAVDPQRNSRVDPQTILTMLWRNIDIHLIFAITNCQIVHSPLLPHHINYKFVSVHLLTTKLANECTRICAGAVIVKLKFQCTRGHTATKRFSEYHPQGLIVSTCKASCKLIWPTTINSEYSSTRQSVPLFPLVPSGCLPKLEEKNIIQWQLQTFMLGYK